MKMTSDRSHPQHKLSHLCQGKHIGQIKVQLPDWINHAWQMVCASKEVMRSTLLPSPCYLSLLEEA